MRPLARWRPTEVRADVGAGFWVAEAPAMRHAIVGALTGAECARSAASATLVFETGAEERVVVVWRNRFVGFVPPSHAAPLRDRLATAGRARLVTEGQVLERDGVWRVWAGPGAPDDAAPGPADELAPPPPRIFGMVIRDERRP